MEEILLASRLDHADTIELADKVDLLALTTEEGARAGVEVTGEPATVKGDARLIARLVRNLMQNALRHGARPVSVAIGRHDGAIELAVRDHGPGIAEAERERVFEPFYRPSGRGEQAGGWGLGPVAGAPDRAAPRRERAAGNASRRRRVSSLPFRQATAEAGAAVRPTSEAALPAMPAKVPGVSRRQLPESGGRFPFHGNAE